MASGVRSYASISRIVLKTPFNLGIKSTLRNPEVSESLLRCVTDKPGWLRGSPLFCASIHSLPGNRIQALSHLLHQPANCRTESTRVQDVSVSWNLGSAGIEELSDFTPLNDKNLQEDVAQQISSCIEQGEHGRLFAVVYVRTAQYKITPGDVIIVKHDFPPNVGDKIRLEKSKQGDEVEWTDDMEGFPMDFPVTGKPVLHVPDDVNSALVLAVGGADFTLFGQPLLSRDQVLVEATVVEKTLSHNRVWFVYQKRQNFQKFHLYRERYSMLVINSIKVLRATDESAHHVEDKDKDLLP